MYSVKPGRGPSLVGGVAGMIAAVFGVFWIFAATSIGAPPFFALFGVVFIGMAIAISISSFYNATSRNRMSAFDVTTETEEGDPIAQALGHSRTQRQTPQSTASEGVRKYPGDHCPFCGVKVEADFDYCPKCGKDI
jgi:hypothetical protein